MQSLQQPVSVLGVHDECQIQVVRRLGQKVHFLLLERLQDGAQLVEDRSYPSPHECDGCAVADDGYPAEPPEVFGHRVDDGGVGDVGAHIDGHGDVALRR